LRPESKIAILGLLLIAAGAFFTLNPSTVRKTIVVPHEYTIADTKLSIDPGHYYYWDFTVPPGSVDPRLHVIVTVYSGGNKDVDVIVLTSGGEKVYSERIAGFAERDILLPGPGDYQLRLSNAFSLVTTKYASIHATLYYKESITKTEQQVSGLADGLIGLGLALLVLGGIIASIRAAKQSAKAFKEGLQGA